MISYLGSLVQFSPATGRAGRCRQISLCVDSTHHVLATLGFAPYRGVCAFPVYTAQVPGCSIWSWPCAECGSSFRVLHKSADSVAPVFCAFPSLSGPGSQRLGRTLPGCGAPFPSAASGPVSQRLAHPLPGSGVPFPSAAPGCATGWVPAAWFVLGGWPLATTLLAADVDHPESRNPTFSFKQFCEIAWLRLDTTVGRMYVPHLLYGCSCCILS